MVIILEIEPLTKPLVCRDHVCLADTIDRGEDLCRPLTNVSMDDMPYQIRLPFRRE
ncbi:hypothetical protein DPMN_176206 [Dreissena polymorpha]|uniref:Uncharacterized protein n=1 Tax=Dreissena polymorpha TaxID=45954 RepID=A0A9D4IKC6_DREPO|nr:hypothetical protein DPMN_082594 [Dreissena polymorpha]KAH3774813.1 hypothetical protein DPMN_176206 [Dreissena polymorpha]